MRRTVWLPLVLTVWWLPLGAAARGAAEPPRPNLIVLLTDDQRWDTLGCYGNRIIHTPHLDALAARGVTFDRAFVTTSICAPNRACILTGQYCARHGMWEFDRELPPEQLAQTYLALLKQAGYRTGFIGKYGVGKPPDELLDFNRAFPGQGNFVVRQSDGTTIHLDRLMGLQAVEFLEGCRPDQPFQLSVSFKGPHVQDSPSVKSVQYPYDPEREIAELYRDITIPPPPTANSDLFERFPDFIKNSENRSRWAVRYWGPERTQESLKGYYRLISGVDLAVGRIVAALERLGLAENTVIVFTSDHGQYLGDYGLAGKWYPHEVSIRVPLIVHDPRLPESRRGVRTQEFALSIDLAPPCSISQGWTSRRACRAGASSPFCGGRPPPTGGRSSSTSIISCRRGRGCRSPAARRSALTAGSTSSTSIRDHCSRSCTIWKSIRSRRSIWRRGRNRRSGSSSSAINS